MSASLGAVGDWPAGNEFGDDANVGDDLDGDGFPELVVLQNRQVPDGTVCIIASSRLPRGGVLDPAEVFPCWHNEVDGEGIETGDIGDFDHDGRPDVLLARHGGLDGYPVFLLPGLVLSWDDPTRW